MVEKMFGSRVGTPKSQDPLDMLTLAMHPPILNKLSFYLYILIEPTKRFKMMPLLFKYLKDK